MPGKEQTRFALWRKNHKDLWQFIMYALVGCLVSAVELSSFAILNFWVFAGYRDKTFSWWLINYTLADGGLTAFLAYAGSFAIAQTCSFVVQRKATFKANNNAAKSAVMFIVLILLLYCFQLYLPTVIREPIAGAIGEALGDLVTKMIVMFCTMLIQFPLSKWVIMKRS